MNTIKNNKRFLALFLSLIMCLGMVSTVFAVDDVDADPDAVEDEVTVVDEDPVADEDPAEVPAEDDVVVDEEETAANEAAPIAAALSLTAYVGQLVQAFDAPEYVPYGTNGIVTVLSHTANLSVSKGTSAATVGGSKGVYFNIIGESAGTATIQLYYTYYTNPYGTGPLYSKTVTYYLTFIEPVLESDNDLALNVNETEDVTLEPLFENSQQYIRNTKITSIKSSNPDVAAVKNSRVSGKNVLFDIVAVGKGTADITAIYTYEARVSTTAVTNDPQWITFTVTDRIHVTVDEDTPSFIYTLTYNGNGGAVNGQAIYTATSGSTTATSYSFDELTAVRDGYQFKGWASTQAIADAGVVDITWPVTLTSADPSKTVYAVWEEESTAPVPTGSITINKVFEGLTVDEIPYDFSMDYTVANALQPQYNVTGTLTLVDFVEFDEETMTVTWTVPHYYRAGGSDITITENGDVAGYTYTTTTSRGVVDNDTHTITTSYSPLIATATLTITNTYTSSTVTPENPKLASIEKERLTSDPGDGVDVAGVNFARVPALGEDDTSVKLLYSITVYGDEGAEYIVTDDGAVYVGGDPMEGVIGESGTAVIYVTKVFGLSEISAGPVTNIAYVTASGDTEPIPGPNPAPSEEISTAVLLPIDVDKDGTDPDEAGISNFTVKVTNTTGSALGFMWLTDTMETGMEIITDSSGNPVYSLKFYAKDGTEIDSIDYDARTVGQTTTWVIQALIEPDAVIELTYQAKITSETGEKLKNKVKAEYSIYEPTRLIADEADLGLFFDSREYDVSGSEAICEIDTSNVVH